MRLCGEWITEEDDGLDQTLGDPGSDLLITTHRTRKQRFDAQLSFFREQLTGGASRDQTELLEQSAMVLGEADEVEFLLVVRYQRDHVWRWHQLKIAGDPTPAKSKEPRWIGAAHSSGRLRRGVLAVQGVDVLPALVIVALPADTAPVDAEALLEACSHAYEGGRCEEPSDEQPDDYVMAELVWVTDTQAEVNVSFETSSTQRSAYRSLDFLPEDEETERYRALGFAVGSLAGKLALSATPKATEEPPPKSTIETEEPKPAPEAEEPAVIEDPVDVLPSVYAPLPTWVEHDFRAGLQVGNGLGVARWGLTLGARRLYDRHLVLDASGAVSTQGSNPDGIEATFINASLNAGVQFETAPIRFSVVAGAAFQLQLMERPSADERHRVDRLGADVALAFRYTDGAVAPFVELRGSYFDVVKLTLEGDTDRTFGPWQVQASAGVLLSPRW